MRHQPAHLSLHVVPVDGMDVQPIEQREGRFHAGLLVVVRSDASVDERGGGRLAEVVADGAEHHRHLLAARQIVDHPARLVDDQQRVDPDVALGMPVGSCSQPMSASISGEAATPHRSPVRARTRRRGGAPGGAASPPRPDPLGRQIVERD